MPYDLNKFFGKEVVDYAEPGDVENFAAVAVRVRSVYEDSRRIADYLTQMLDEPGVDALEALVIGHWDEHGAAAEGTPQEGVELLVSSKEALPNLRALFIGDISSEENEISWIVQGDMSALWSAFPTLEHFQARGGNGLRLGRVNHARLRTLIIETGGLPAPLLREALDADAPLTHFEMWLGDANYGANTTIGDFEPLFAGDLFPELKTLGLRNAEYSDVIAEALVASPLLERLEVLDLSLGTLTDRGARALAGSGKIGHLKRLDISHHFVGAEAVAALAAATSNLVADDPEAPDEWDGETHYFVAVSE